MEEYPKRVGNITEMRVMAELLKYGEVSIPFGNNARYDCILDIDGKLIKIQIKTARRFDDNRFMVPFANTKTNAHESVRKAYSPDDVDFIATYYDDCLYLFPTGTHNNSFTVSFQYPSNGLKKRINIASDFLADKVLGQYCGV